MMVAERGHESYSPLLSVTISNPTNIKQVDIKSSKSSRIPRKIRRNMIKVSEINSEGREAEIVYLDDIDHMRKVVSYCKRLLTQEEKAKQDRNIKNYKSLKTGDIMLRKLERGVFVLNSTRDRRMCMCRLHRAVSLWERRQNKESLVWNFGLFS